jgi:hypothetical protein
MSTLAHQTLVEHQILAHVKDALRLTLETKVTSVSFERKLSSVHFMSESFHRHLERLLALEEDGGYLDLVRQNRPELLDRVVALRAEHAEFRHSLRQILQGLEASADDESFHGICHKLRDLLDRLDRHDAQEIDLLEQVLIDRADRVA